MEIHKCKIVCNEFHLSSASPAENDYLKNKSENLRVLQLLYKSVTYVQVAAAGQSPNRGQAHPPRLREGQDSAPGRENVSTEARLTLRG
jgi:hypothetical protein